MASIIACSRRTSSSCVMGVFFSERQAHMAAERQMSAAMRNGFMAFSELNLPEWDERSKVPQPKRPFVTIGSFKLLADVPQRSIRVHVSAHAPHLQRARPGIGDSYAGGA